MNKSENLQGVLHHLLLPVKHGLRAALTTERFGLMTGACHTFPPLFRGLSTPPYLQWGREAAQRVRRPVVGGEAHDGLQDVLTPGALYGVGAREEVCGRVVGKQVGQEPLASSQDHKDPDHKGLAPSCSLMQIVDRPQNHFCSYTEDQKLICCYMTHL